jgi:DNA-binding transcriptional regulator YiaG
MTRAASLEKLRAMSETAERSLNPHAVSVTGASQLVEVGLLRDNLHHFAEDARGLHREELTRELDGRAMDLAQQGATALLEQISVSWGLSWTSVARMIGVSDTAVRKWRRGESVTSENLRQLARLVAFLRLIKEQNWVSDVAAWLDMRIAEASTLTPVDLYPEHVDLLFELATRRITAHDALERFDPAWRDHYSVDTRLSTVQSDDGPVLRLGERSDA